MLAAGAPKRPVPVAGTPKRLVPVLAAGAPNRLVPVLAGAPNRPVEAGAAGAPNRPGPALEVVGAVRENAGVDVGIAVTPKPPGLSEEPRVEAPKGVVLAPSPWAGTGATVEAGRRDCLANSLKDC